MELLLLSITGLNEMVAWNFAKWTFYFGLKPFCNALFTKEVITAKKGYWIND
jgi:hypothetical protein